MGKHPKANIPTFAICTFSVSVHQRMAAGFQQSCVSHATVLTLNPGVSPNSAK